MAKTLTTLVPRTELASIQDKGLLSLQALEQEKELFARVARDRGMSEDELRGRLQTAFQDPERRNIVRGPNAFFKLPPSSVVLDANHPSKLRDLVPVQIDLDALRKRQRARLYGIELTPYSEKETTVRHRWLTPNDEERLFAQTAENLWKNYKDIKGRGLYAPNVPHAALVTRGGIVPPGVLSFPHNKEKKTMTEHEKIAILQRALAKGRAAYDKAKPFLVERAQEYAQNVNMYPGAQGVTSPSGAALHLLSNAFYDPAMQAAKAVGGVAQKKGVELLAKNKPLLAAGHLQAAQPAVPRAGAITAQSMPLPQMRSAPSAAEGGRGDALRGLVYTKRSSVQYPFLYAEALTRWGHLIGVR